MTQPATNQELFIQPADCPAGLFDKIILAIAKEHELSQTKKILFLFLILLAVSLVSLPFSYTFFISQWRVSGSGYFIGAALANLDIFFTLWQDFLLSMLETLPVLGMALFTANVALLVFTARLFLYKKGLLLHYIRHNL